MTLLDSLNKGQKIWIVPVKADYHVKCNCGHDTFPSQISATGGIFIHYDAILANGDITLNDILFHELVHAYRMGLVGYSNMINTDLLSYGGDYEEFFAMVMQNIYLACAGSQSFRLSYKNTNTWEPVEYAYRAFTDDPGAFEALTYFLKKDPLAIRVANWQNPIYNPFRDFGSIQGKYNRSGRIKSMFIPRILW